MLHEFGICICGAMGRQYLAAKNHMPQRFRQPVMTLHQSRAVTSISLVQRNALTQSHILLLYCDCGTQWTLRRVSATSVQKL